MDIEKEIRILEEQTIVFCKGSELGNMYEAMVKRCGLDTGNNLAFAASVFYNLGRIHGIRAERARRNLRRRKSAS